MGATLQDMGKRGGVEPVLLWQKAGREGFGCVAGLDGHDGLAADGSCIELIGHLMHRGAMQGHAGGNGSCMCVKPWKQW